MLTDDSKIKGMPIRTEIRIPRSDGTSEWLTSVVICQDTNPAGVPIGSFVVWSVYTTGGQVEAQNGHYGISDYGRALEVAYERARDRIA